jgi:inosine-uridine nucleoside N-ribohydrolase
MLKKMITDLKTRTYLNIFWATLSSAIIYGCSKEISSTQVKTTSSSQVQKKQMIIDTDMAIDDWNAILYLLKAPSIEIKGIAIPGTGEANCEPGMKNALSLLHLAGLTNSQIPVTCGDSIPLAGDQEFPKAWRDDVNRFYGVNIEPSPNKPLEIHAVDWYQKVLTQYAPKSVDIVVLGPATNIAQLLKKDTGATKAIRKVHVMGGAFFVKGNIIVPGFTDHLQNKTSEWNIYADPLAAKIMFESDLDIVVTPLDATNKVKVTHEYVRKFKEKAKTPEAKFVDQIFDKNDWFVASGEYYFWDPLAAAIAADEDMCSLNTQASSSNPAYQKARVDVRVDYGPGETLHKRPKLVEATSGQTLIIQSGSQRQNATICLDAKADYFMDEFIRVLNLPK